MREPKFKVWNKREKKMSKPFGFGDLYGYEGETNAVTLHHPYTGQGQEFDICSHRGGSPVFPQDQVDEGVNKDLVFLQYSDRKDKHRTEIYDGNKIKINFGQMGDVIYEVLYDSGTWYLTGNDEEADDFLSNFRDDELEVVGHIYEEEQNELPKK